MAIFSHQDCDGDGVEILADSDDPQEDLVLLTSPRTGDRSVGVRLDRGAVLRLREALDEWLAEQGAVPKPVYPADSVYGQLIAQAVRAEVARVLPLHQAPTAAVGIDCPEPIRPGQLLADVHRDCGFVWAMHRRAAARCETHCQVMHDSAGNEVIHDAADPEPHDVGHPVYEDAKPHPVVNLSWDDKLWGMTGQPPSANGYCGGCGHAWDLHSRQGHKCMSLVGKGMCSCREVRP